MVQQVTKGIKISSPKSIEISKENLSKLLNFDFSPYRNEKSIRSIQIFNGPEIELISFNELEKKGLLISEKLKNDLNINDSYIVKALGSVLLKGKLEEVGIYTLLEK